jgi:hypothetical protein
MCVPEVIFRINVKKISPAPPAKRITYMHRYVQQMMPLKRNMRKSRSLGPMTSHSSKVAPSPGNFGQDEAQL